MATAPATRPKGRGPGAARTCTMTTSKVLGKLGPSAAAAAAAVTGVLLSRRAHST
jgi:hypothetical protein